MNLFYYYRQFYWKQIYNLKIFNLLQNIKKCLLQNHDIILCFIIKPFCYCKLQFQSTTPKPKGRVIVEQSMYIDIFYRSIKATEPISTNKVAIELCSLYIKKKIMAKGHRVYDFIRTQSVRLQFEIYFFLIGIFIL